MRDTRFQQVKGISKHNMFEMSWDLFLDYFDYLGLLLLVLGHRDTSRNLEIIEMMSLRVLPQANRTVINSN